MRRWGRADGRDEIHGATCRDERGVTVSLTESQTEQQTDENESADETGNQCEDNGRRKEDDSDTTTTFSAFPTKEGHGPQHPARNDTAQAQESAQVANATMEGGGRKAKRRKEC